MYHGIVICGGVDGAHDGFCLLHERKDGGEGGGEVVEGLLSAVPAWPMGKATNSARPQYFMRAAMGKGYFRYFRDLHVATELFLEADLDDDYGALFLVERGRVWRGGVWCPPYIDEEQYCAMAAKE
jgi:hypothetical protein